MAKMQFVEGGGAAAQEFEVGEQPGFFEPSHYRIEAFRPFGMIAAGEMAAAARIGEEGGFEWHSQIIACDSRDSYAASYTERFVYTLCYAEAVVISGFDWDDDNAYHIERHQFTPEEVEEVFAGNYKVRRTRQKLYLALGETLDGRLAFVVFRRLSGGMIRVITARDMDDSERRLFRHK
jgi:uncharacterized DUF497 family protein